MENNMTQLSTNQLDTYVKLHSSVMSNSKIGGNDKVVYALLLSMYTGLKAKGHRLFITKKTIAEKCGIGHATAQRCVATLVEHGLIEVKKEHRHGFTDRSIYVVKDHVSTENVITTKQEKPEVGNKEGVCPFTAPSKVRNPVIKKTTDLLIEFDEPF